MRKVVASGAQLARTREPRMRVILRVVDVRVRALFYAMKLYIVSESVSRVSRAMPDIIVTC